MPNLGELIAEEIDGRRCQICRHQFPRAYALEFRDSDGKLECMDCCFARERRERQIQDDRR